MIVIITRAIKKYSTTTSYETIKKEARKIMDYKNHNKKVKELFDRRVILSKETYPIDDGLHTGEDDKKYIGIKNVCVYRDLKAYGKGAGAAAMMTGAQRLIDNGWELTFEVRDVSDIAWYDDTVLVGSGEKNIKVRGE